MTKHILVYTPQGLNNGGYVTEDLRKVASDIVEDIAEEFLLSVDDVVNLVLSRLDKADTEILRLGYTQTVYVTDSHYIYVDYVTEEFFNSLEDWEGKK